MNTSVKTFYSQTENNRTELQRYRHSLIVCTLAFLLVALNASAQDIIGDPKGDFLFGVPITTLQLELASKNIGLSGPLWHHSKKEYYIVDSIYGTNDKIYTMAKSRVLFFKFNLASNTKNTLIFNSKTNYSPSFEVGHAWGFDSLRVPSAKAGTYWCYSLSAGGEYQNFRYYDTLLNAVAPEKTQRVSPFVKANVTVFRTTLFAVSFSLQYNRKINTDKLMPYQNLTNTFYIDNNVATAGTTEGYLTPVPVTDALRLSIATPQFGLSGEWNKKLPFAVTPYLYSVYVPDTKPSNNAGIVLSFLPGRFRKFDRVETATRNDKKPYPYKNKAVYKFKQALNVGLNLYSSDSTDKVFIFVSGTFNIGNLMPKKGTDAPNPSSQQQ